MTCGYLNMQNPYLDWPGSVGTGDPDPQVRYFAGIPTGQPASTCGSTLLVSSLTDNPAIHAPHWRRTLQLFPTWPSIEYCTTQPTHERKWESGRSHSPLSSSIPLPFPLQRHWCRYWLPWWKARGGWACLARPRGGIPTETVCDTHRHWRHCAGDRKG